MILLARDVWPHLFTPLLLPPPLQPITAAAAPNAAAAIPTTGANRPSSVRTYTLRHSAASSSSSRVGSTTAEPPLLILHGVGFGLMSYLPLVARLAATGRPILCMQIRHVSMQLTSYIPTSSEVADDIIAVMDKLGIDQVRRRVNGLETSDVCFECRYHGT